MRKAILSIIAFLIFGIVSYIIITKTLSYDSLMKIFG